MMELGEEERGNKKNKGSCARRCVPKICLLKLSSYPIIGSFPFVHSVRGLYGVLFSLHVAVAAVPGDWRGQQQK